jgi:uncharacterized protein involved in exopolysaccharide biosynthesis
VVTLLGGALAVGVALVRQRVYRSETLMLYREGIRPSDLLGGDVGGDPARKLGLKLKEKVLSRRSLEPIVRELHLYPAIVEERGYVDAVDQMRGDIAFRIRDGDTFGLSFEGTSPRLVQTVTARLADALVRDNASNRIADATTTKDFLDDERSKSERDLGAKETALAHFLGEHPEFAREAVIGAGAASVVEPRVVDRATSDATLTALARGARRIERQLSAPVAIGAVARGPGTTSVAIADPARALAESELRAARQELERRRARYTEQHPDVVAARLEVSALTRRLDALVAPLAPSAHEVPADDPAPLANRAELVQSLAKIRAEMSSYRAVASEQQKAPSVDAANLLVALEARSTLLNREVAGAREWQRQVADRQLRADITASSVASADNAQMEILDPAYLPTHPVRGGRTLVVLVGLLLALGLALALATARALLDDRVHERADLERLALGEVLAVIARAPRRTRSP